jgi:hypothetical protein
MSYPSPAANLRACSFSFLPAFQHFFGKLGADGLILVHGAEKAAAAYFGV